MTARHAYLGELEDVERPHPSYFAHGTVMQLPLIFLRDIVIFPGEEIPLRMLTETGVDTIREQLSTEGVLLGVLCPDQIGTPYGTTVRVERFGLAQNGASVMGVAKQRFRLAPTRNNSHRVGHADVEILADFQPPRLPFPVSSAHGSERDGKTHKKRRRAPMLFPSYWGLREYGQFDARQLVDHIRGTMISAAHCSWFQRISAHEPNRGLIVHYLVPQAAEQQDPIRFAFWVAANLPLDHAERLELLRIDCVVRLLRRELAILEQLQEHIYCSRCGTFLAQMTDMFSMTDDGVAGTFVNPGGHVHQIMTLRDVQSEHVLVDEARSTEDSWFPGFAWSIVYCSHCFVHLGWQFDRTTETLEPSRFFGFRRAALTQSPPPERVLGNGDSQRNHSEEESEDDEAESSSSNRSSNSEEPIEISASIDWEDPPTGTPSGHGNEE